MTAAPVITTDRLTLRPQRDGDFADFAAALARPEAKYMGGPFDTRLAWAIFAADTGSWALKGFGAWAVERTADGAHVGQVALAHPPQFPEAELGWLTYPAHRGQGYAREAAAAARDHAYRALGWTTAVSYIHPENAASIRVAEALGARLDDDAAKPDPEDLVYRHPAPGEVRP